MLEISSDSCYVYQHVQIQIEVIYHILVSIYDSQWLIVINSRIFQSAAQCYQIKPEFNYNISRELAGPRTCCDTDNREE